MCWQQTYKKQQKHTRTTAPNSTPSFFNLPPGTLSSITSTSRGSNRANADVNIEAAADATAAMETMPDEAENEPKELEGDDDDEVEFTYFN